MSEALYEAETYEAFWRAYERAHAHPTTRRWHAVATLTAGTLIAAGVVAKSPLLLLAAPLADYAIAQASHRIVEGNRTQPWRRPHWHLRAELELCAQTLREATRGRAQSPR